MENCFILKCKIIPLKLTNRVIGQMEDGTIKIELKAKPVDGEANRVLLNFLSKIIQIEKSKITIISGFRSKNKLIKIESGNKDLVLEKLFIK